MRALTAGGTVVVDLAGVPFIDSAGLGALVGAYISSRHVDRKLVLAGAGERITALIRMSKLEQFFPLYASAAEAASTP